MTVVRDIVRDVARNLASDITSRYGGDDYAILGFSPKLVTSFVNEYYRKAANDTTFGGLLTHSRSGNATMVDSDGVLKWAPHNLVLNSASPATQSITVVSGADYTVECTGSGSVTLSNAGAGTVTAGNPVEITAASTTLTLTVSGGPSTMWAYRSDFGGMVNNPDTGTSYVATTGAAKYLPRRGHHIYNGTSWVNEGILVESEARTNLLTYSEDFTDSSWLTGGLNSVVTADQTPSVDGSTNADKLAVDSVGGTTSTVGLAKSITVATSTKHTLSCFAKADQSDFIFLGAVSLTTPANGGVWFNLSNGTVGTQNTGHSGQIEDWGGGWYRCSVTFTTDATDTSGQARIYLDNADGGSTITRDGNSSIYIYGAQFEAGSTPSSYIPTSGATATRAAETLTIAAANLPYDSAAMSVAVKGKSTYADEGAAAQITLLRWYADANNYLTIDVDTDGAATGEVNFNQSASATLDTVASAAGTYSPGANVDFNIASAHTSGRINGAVDGTALTENATPTALPDLSSTDLLIANDFMGVISEFKMYDADITDAGLSLESAS